MNPLIQCKTKILPLLVVLACFGLLPKAQAVIPPPDGGYPGGNTAEGQSALFSLTTGTYNTAVGFLSLRSNTLGNFNTAIGAGALFANVGDPTLSQASSNTATGAGALLSNSTGNANTATGSFALVSNTEGVFNTAVGTSALFHNSMGFQNTATGLSALFNNTTGHDNTACGFNALPNATGSFNTALGYQAGNGVTTATNVVAIQHPGTDINNSCFIGNIYTNVQPVVGTDPDYVTITSIGRLGRGNVSSRRYKHDIEPINKASEVLFALKPVSFRYNKEYDCTQTLAFGLIAEEVAEVAPHLVGRNPAGQPESVRYEQINAMLLNEFLKEHGKVEELEANDAEQQREIKALVTTVKEQAAQIQKVRAEIGMSKAMPNVVLSSP